MLGPRRPRSAMRPKTLRDSPRRGHDFPARKPLEHDAGMLIISMLINTRKARVTKPFDPDRSLGVLISDVARLLRRNFDRRLQSLGLTQAQWRAIVHVSRSEGMNQVALAECLEIQPITVARLIDRMESSGLDRTAQRPARPPRGATVPHREVSAGARGDPRSRRGDDRGKRARGRCEHAEPGLRRPATDQTEPRHGGAENIRCERTHWKDEPRCRTKTDPNPTHALARPQHPRP